MGDSCLPTQAASVLLMSRWPKESFTLVPSYLSIRQEIKYYCNVEHIVPLETSNYKRQVKHLACVSVCPNTTCMMRSKPLVKSQTFRGGNIKNLQAAGDRWQ